MISGKYVNTFAEATHALPVGLHMSSDYPFKMPRIKARTPNTVTLLSDSGDTEVTLAIERTRSGREVLQLDQRSFFETAFGRPPTRFVCYAFKDRATPLP